MQRATVHKAAWWIIAAGLVAFAFTGGSTKDQSRLPLETPYKSFRLSENVDDRRKDVPFAERFDAVYLSTMTCRTDSECETAELLEAFPEFKYWEVDAVAEGDD